MSNLIRREPFAIEDMFDDLMKGYWVRPMRLFGEQVEMIKMDVKEGEKAYTIHAELPGVKKEDIHVTLEGKLLTIHAEVKKTSEEKEGEKVLRRERVHGEVSRTMSLGTEVDETAADARFENGVLELTLPKKATVAPRALAVH